MTKILCFLLLVLSSSSFAFEDLNVGVSVLGSRGESDNFDVNGVFLFDYSGYGIDVLDDLEVQMVPTSLELSFTDGRKTKVYTDLATLQYYGEEKFSIMVQAISLDYKNDEDYIIQKNSKVAIAELGVSKFFNLGALEFDVSVLGGFGGKIKSEDLITPNMDSISTRHKYTAEVMAGVYIPISDSVGAYAYGGHSNLKSGSYKETSQYLGVEVPFYNNTYNSSIYFTVENIDRNYVSESSRGPSVDDQLVTLGLRIRF